MTREQFNKKYAEANQKIKNKQTTTSESFKSARDRLVSEAQNKFSKTKDLKTKINQTVVYVKQGLEAAGYNNKINFGNDDIRDIAQSVQKSEAQKVHSKLYKEIVPIYKDSKSKNKSQNVPELKSKESITNITSVPSVLSKNTYDAKKELEKTAKTVKDSVDRNVVEKYISGGANGVKNYTLEALRAPKDNTAESSAERQRLKIGYYSAIQELVKGKSVSEIKNLRDLEVKKAGDNTDEINLILDAYNYQISPEYANAAAMKRSWETETGDFEKLKKEIDDGYKRTNELLEQASLSIVDAQTAYGLYGDEQSKAEYDEARRRYDNISSVARKYDAKKREYEKGYAKYNYALKMLSNADKIAEYMDKSDFDEKSRTDDSINDQRYRAYNGLSKNGVTYGSVQSDIDPYIAYMDTGKLLTENEKKVYNYIYKSEGIKSAEKYIDSIKPLLDLRKAEEIGADGNTFEGLMWNIGGALEGSANYIKEGIDVLNPFTSKKDYYFPTVSEMVAGEYLENSEGAEKTLYTVAGAVSGQLIPLALSTVPVAGPYLSKGAFFLQAFGNSYTQSINEGKDTGEAYAYGLFSASMEFATEMAVGGLSYMGDSGLTRLSKTAAGKNITARSKRAFDSLIKSDRGKAALRLTFGYIADGISEGAEEYLSSTIDPLARNFFFGESNDFTLMSDEQLEESVAGFFCALILNAPTTSMSSASVLKNSLSSKLYIIETDGTLTDSQKKEKSQDIILSETIREYYKLSESFETFEEAQKQAKKDGFVYDIGIFAKSAFDIGKKQTDAEISKEVIDKRINEGIKAGENINATVKAILKDENLKTSAEKTLGTRLAADNNSRATLRRYINRLKNGEAQSKQLIPLEQSVINMLSDGSSVSHIAAQIDVNDGMFYQLAEILGEDLSSMAAGTSAIKITKYITDLQNNYIASAANRLYPDADTRLDYVEKQIANEKAKEKAYDAGLNKRQFANTNSILSDVSEKELRSAYSDGLSDRAIYEERGEISAARFKTRAEKLSEKVNADYDSFIFSDAVFETGDKSNDIKTAESTAENTVKNRDNVSTSAEKASRTEVRGAFKEKEKLSSENYSGYGVYGNSVADDIRTAATKQLVLSGVNKTVAARHASDAVGMVYQKALDGKNTHKNEYDGILTYSEVKRIYDAAAKDKQLRENRVYHSNAEIIKDEFYKKAKVSGADERVLNAFAQITGLNIRFEELDGKNAYIDTSKGEIIISTKAQNPVKMAIIHEVIHDMRIVSPEEYNALKAVICDFLSSRDIAATQYRYLVLRSYKEDILDKDGNYIEGWQDNITEEMVCDLYSGVIQNEALIRKLGRKNAKGFLKVAYAILDFADSIRYRIKMFFSSPDLKDASTAYRALARRSESMARGFINALENAYSCIDNEGRAKLENYELNKGDRKQPEDKIKNSREIGTDSSNDNEYNYYEGVRDSKILGNGDSITEKDVAAIQSIGRKSVNEFTSEDIKKTEGLARRYFKEMGTKSPFFCAWFGDWRAYDKTLLKVAKIPKYIASNEERKVNRGMVVNADTGWDIRISREGETNTISHSGADRLSEYGLAGIKDILENAVLLDAEVHEHHSNNAKNDMITFDHKLYSLGENSEHIALYKITVEEYFQSKSEPSNKKFHNLKYIEKVAELPADALAVKNRSGGSAIDNLATKYSISDLYSFVKQYDKEFNPTPANPLLLNDDGTPKVFYHGTSSNDNFTVFDTYGSNFGLFGTGSYFTDNKSIANTYENKGKGSNKRTYDVYLNIRNPLDIDAAFERNKWENAADSDLLPYFKDCRTNEDAFKALKEYCEDEMFYRYEGEEFIRDFIEKMGYDGITHIGGGRHGSSDGTRHRVMIAFELEQIKSATDNIGTFDKNNPDIRYSNILDDSEKITEEDRIHDKALTLKQRSIERWRAGVDLENGKKVKIKPLNVITKQMADAFKLPVSSGKYAAEGVAPHVQYSKYEKTLRTAFKNDLPAVCSGIALHLDAQLDLSGDILRSTQNAMEQSGDTQAYGIYENELATLVNDYDGSAKMTTGALCEYIRRYIINPNDAKNACPMFSDLFEKKLSENSELSEAIQKCRDIFLSYAKLGVEQRFSSAILTQKEFDKFTHSKLDDIKAFFPNAYKSIVDGFNPIKTVIKSSGGDFKDAKGGYVLATNSVHSASQAAYIVGEAMIDMNGRRVGESFSDIYADLKKLTKEQKKQGLTVIQKSKDFSQYLVMRHAPEWLSKTEAVTAGGKEVSSGAKRVFADETLNNSEECMKRAAELEKKYPEFVQLAKRVYNFQDNLINYWIIPSGAQSKEQIEKLRALYPNYVPFYRLTERADGKKPSNGLGRGFANLKNPFQIALGSGDIIRDPIESIMISVQKATDFARRNAVTVSLAHEFTGKDAIPGVMSRIYSDAELKRIENLTETTGLSTAEDIFGAESYNVNENSFSPTVSGAEGVVCAWVDGKKQYYKVYDADVYNALAGLAPQQLHWFFKASRFVLSWSKALITTFNPLFAISNAIRDSVTFYHNSDTVYTPIGVAFGYILSLKDIITNDEVYQTYRAMGGGDSTRIRAELKAFQKQVKLDAKTSWENMYALERVRAVVSTPLTLLKSFINGYVNINEVVESLPRITEFRNRLKRGEDVQRAFYESQDVTTNFNRSGQGGKMLNTVLIFSNASVQGVDRLARSFGDASRKELAIRVGKYIAFGFLTTAIRKYWNRDDEAKEAYSHLSNYTKNNFMCLYIGDGKFLKLPKAREISIPETFINRLADFIFDGDEKAFEDFGGYIADNIIPPFIPKSLSPSDMLYDLGSNTFIGAGVDILANRDFKGSQIVPDSLDYRGNEFEKYYDDTWHFAVWLSEQLYDKTGHDISPLAIEHFYASNAGWSGTLVTGLFPVSQVRNEEIGPIKSVKNNFVSSLGFGKRYTADSRYSTDILNDVYEKAEKISGKAARKKDGESFIAKEKWFKLKSFCSTYNKTSRLGNTEQQRDDRLTLLRLITGFDDTMSETDKYIAQLYDKEKVDEIFINSYPTASELEKTIKGVKYHCQLTPEQYVEYCAEIDKTTDAVRALVMESGADSKNAILILTKAKSKINSTVKDRFIKKYGERVKSDDKASGKTWSYSENQESDSQKETAIRVNAKSIYSASKKSIDKLSEEAFNDELDKLING